MTQNFIAEKNVKFIHYIKYLKESNMAEQYLPSLFNNSAEHKHQDFPQVQEIEKKTKRIDSLSEIKLHLSEDELNKETRENDSRNQLKNGETDTHRIITDVLGLLKKRQNDMICSQLSRKEHKSYRGEQHNKTSKSEQKTHLDVVKQKASKCIHNGIEKESCWEFKSLTLKEKEAAILPGENCERSVKNSNMNAEEKETVDSTDAGSARSRTAIKVPKAMRIAREQSKSLLNNLYVEELLDDLILFNLLIEHKLTVQKLENIKETLVHQKEKEENKLNEITETGKENGGFVIDYDVLYEKEYEVWIKRMEARALAETRREASCQNLKRIPGNVGRPTLWKGYYY